MTVTVVYADTADGLLTSSSATYATAQGGSGVTANTTSTGHLTGQHAAAGPVYSVYEVFFPFDTSAIPDSDTVSAATLDLWCLSDATTTDFTVNARTFDFGATVEATDWRATSGTSETDTLLATFGTAGLSVGAYATFTSTGSFPGAVNKTGTTRLYIVSSRTEADTAPSVGTTERWTVAAADTSGTTNDPMLTVVHAGSATAASKAYSYRLRRV